MFNVSPHVEDLIAISTVLGNKSTKIASKEPTVGGEKIISEFEFEFNVALSPHVETVRTINKGSKLRSFLSLLVWTGSPERPPRLSHSS